MSVGDPLRYKLELNRFNSAPLARAFNPVPDTILGASTTAVYPDDCVVHSAELRIPMLVIPTRIQHTVRRCRRVDL